MVRHITANGIGKSGVACVEMALKHLLEQPERCSEMLQESSSTVKQDQILAVLGLSSSKPSANSKSSGASNVLPIDLAYYLYMMRVPAIMTSAVLGAPIEAEEADAARANKLFRIAPSKYFPVTRRFVAVSELKAILAHGHQIIAHIDSRFIRYVREGELLSVDDAFDAPRC
ncbi:hypothetical protein J8273_3317 [Carpediemonas membranifera]|uniref:Uncharacterized protein n=1 Tax=Carpediemonas membranifera TaxID=201153 RepID=A0A8J6E3H4_9EUKA|nr:hypothetical protein J8273_3317 [Carpediemonas membranifera]|eukprot:KAG9393187.1 hypothetical protein J8273_3317 [Carpediemonas membranifera]